MVALWGLYLPVPIRLVAFCLHKNRAVWCDRYLIRRLDFLVGWSAMVRICREVLSDNGRAGDRTLFGRYEHRGVGVSHL